MQGILFTFLFALFKSCVRYFYQIFIFSPNVIPSKIMKKALFFLELFKFLSFSPSIFLYLSAIALEDDPR